MLSIAIPARKFIHPDSPSNLWLAVVGPASHRQPWRGALSLSTVQDRTDPADMESMLKKCVLTLVLAWRVGAAVEPEVSFSGPACLGWGECATHPAPPSVRFALLSLLAPRNLSRQERPSDLLLHKSLHCVRERGRTAKFSKRRRCFRRQIGQTAACVRGRT